MHIKNYKGLIFDFFEVISPGPAHVWFEKNVPNKNYGIWKRKYLSSADKGEISYEEIVTILHNMTNIPKAQIKKEWEDLVFVDKALISTIKKLHKTHKIALCSDAISEYLRIILKNYNLESLFDVIIISSELGYTKENPKMLQKTITELEMSASDIIFIDDNINNQNTAKKLGIDGVLYTSHAKLLEELQLD